MTKLTQQERLQHDAKKKLVVGNNRFVLRREDNFSNKKESSSSPGSRSREQSKEGCEENRAKFHKLKQKKNSLINSCMNKKSSLVIACNDGIHNIISSSVLQKSKASLKTLSSRESKDPKDDTKTCAQIEKEIVELKLNYAIDRSECDILQFESSKLIQKRDTIIKQRKDHLLREKHRLKNNIVLTELLIFHQKKRIRDNNIEQKRIRFDIKSLINECSDHKIILENEWSDSSTFHEHVQRIHQHLDEWKKTSHNLRKDIEMIQQNLVIEQKCQTQEAGSKDNNSRRNQRPRLSLDLIWNNKTDNSDDDKSNSYNSDIATRPCIDDPTVIISTSTSTLSSTTSSSSFVISPVTQARNFVKKLFIKNR